MGYEHGAHELALVLVQAFDLHIEHGVGVHLKALGLPGVLGEVLLVEALDLAQAGENLFVLLELPQLAQLLGAAQIARADELFTRLSSLGLIWLSQRRWSMPLVM